MMLCREGGRVVVSMDVWSAEVASFEGVDEMVFVLERVWVEPGGLLEFSFIKSDRACRDGSPEDLLNQSGAMVDLSLGCLE